MAKITHKIITNVIMVAYSISITLSSDSLMGFYMNRGLQSLCCDRSQKEG